MDVWIVIPVLLLAFLMGSIPTGYLIVRWRKREDIRAKGSYSIGGTNVASECGRRWGLLTILVDILKGLIPVSLAIYLLGLNGVSGTAGLLAVTGHIFPPFISKPRFKGGKGVATAIGSLFSIFVIILCNHFFPWIFVLAVVLTPWITMIILKRQMGPANIVLMILIIPLFIVMEIMVGTNLLAVPICLMAGLILWAHRQNWGRWQRGEEREVEKEWEK
jgi:glycerol-3-phosphate acyltransferase PlsY